jgi:hypothetical protein
MPAILNILDYMKAHTKKTTKKGASKWITHHLKK